jgi:hypothetical protein
MNPHCGSLPAPRAALPLTATPRRPDDFTMDNVPRMGPQYVLFSTRSGSRAVLVNFIAGWAVLPSACFTPTPATHPYWILGTCLPSNYLLSKASVTGMTCLAGIFWWIGLYWAGFSPISGICQCLFGAPSRLGNRQPSAV